MPLPILFLGLMLSGSALGAIRLAEQLPPATWAKVVDARTHLGDPAKGEALFGDAARLACVRCHLVYGREIRRGAPNLFGIGDKFGFEDLVLAVERPSESILPGFEAVEIATADGESFTGTLKRVDKAGYVLSLATGADVTIPRDQVVDRRESRVSLMPEGLTSGLSSQEYADLFAFLLSLKTDQSDALIGKHRSAGIRVLKDSVSLSPFMEVSLAFVGPVWMSPFPGKEEAYIVLEHQLGRAWRLEKRGDSFEKKLFLELEPQTEMAADGLVGFAFHPNYHYNRRYFVKYNTTIDAQLQTVIEERVATRTSQRDSGRGARRLLTVNQPAGNHNGGCLIFGPDDYLYAAFGDGGPQRDPNGYSQSNEDLKGSLIRIDVDSRYHDKPYGIPPDNPLISDHEQNPNIYPEIWAMGFREPWRFSFDRQTGDLWLGDVGQSSFEEIALVKRGENHGWNVMEAFDEFSAAYRRDGVHYSDPVFAYSRKLGTSITGGYVYRGNPESALYGYYICGDHESRRLFAVKRGERELESAWELGFSPQRIAAFCETQQGKLLLVGYQGMIYELDLDRVELIAR